MNGLMGGAQMPQQGGANPIQVLAQQVQQLTNDVQALKSVVYQIVQILQGGPGQGQQAPLGGPPMGGPSGGMPMGGGSMPPQQRPMGGQMPQGRPYGR